MADIARDIDPGQEPVIIDNMPNATYHADPCVQPSLSAGMIRDYTMKTPAHVAANSARLNPDFEEDNDTKFDVGSLVHAMMLGERDRVGIVFENDWRKKSAQEARAEILEGGGVPALEKHVALAQDMIDAAAEHMEGIGVAKWFADGAGIGESSVFWSEAGILHRARPDWRVNGEPIWVDVKTTKAGISDESLMRAAADRGLDVTGAHYLAAMQACALHNREYLFLFIEDSPPHACRLMRLDQELIVLGQRKRKRAIARHLECLRAQHWPAYRAEIGTIEAPPWEEARQMEREERTKPDAATLARVYEWQGIGGDNDNAA